MLSFAVLCLCTAYIYDALMHFVRGVCATFLWYVVYMLSNDTLMCWFNAFPSALYKFMMRIFSYVLWYWVVRCSYHFCAFELTFLSMWIKSFIYFLFYILSQSTFYRRCSYLFFFTLFVDFLFIIGHRDLVLSSFSIIAYKSDF